MTLFDFSDFLDLADQLSAHSDEAAWRSAVSRAYYAILHVAYEALPVPMRLSISHGAIHRQTWQAYSASSVIACRRVGQTGWRLRTARVDADYRSIVAVTQAQSQRSLADARRALELLKQYGYQT